MHDQQSTDPLDATPEDAARWEFFAEHFLSEIDGKRLIVWLADNAFRLGGIDRAIDEARNRQATQA